MTDREIVDPQATRHPFGARLTPMKVLLIEDDLKLAEHLVHNLREHALMVEHARSLTDLQTQMEADGRFDLVILDRLIGQQDTKRDLPRLKAKWPEAPVLILSAISTPQERSELLNLGADDYMGKPFSTQELIARLKVLSRRHAQAPNPYLRVGDVILDTLQRTLTVGGQVENLPAKEFLLLRVLCKEPGRVWSRDELLDYVWGANIHLQTNVVEATIANVRRKLESLGAKATIKNMRNAGYWIQE